ncbi:MAG TPA: hypothetical protein VGB59_00925 [Allosphingosinicella sp.]
MAGPHHIVTVARRTDFADLLRRVKRRRVKPTPPWHPKSRDEGSAPAMAEPDRPNPPLEGGAAAPLDEEA